MDHDIERLPDAYRAGTTKLRTRWDLDATGEPDPTRMSDGDFLSRLTALYGPPRSKRLDYVFRHRPTGIVFTAYSAGSGPAYGGGPVLPGELPPPPSPRDAMLQTSQRGRSEPAGFLEIVRAFDAELARAAPVDCELIRGTDDGLHRFGARNGVPFDEKLSTVEAIGFYLAQLPEVEARHVEPSSARLRELEVHMIEVQLRQLVVAASPEARAAHPEAVAHASAAWARDLAELEATVNAVEPRHPEITAARLRALKEHAAALGLDGRENQARLVALARPGR